MSFIARLVLGDNEYTVLSADFEVSQQLGRHNLPNHATEIGLVNLVVESSNRNELWDWAMSDSMSKNGSVVFYRRDAISPLKTLEFENAFCIKYREVFESEGSVPMRIHMTLSPYVLRMQGTERSQPWSGFDSGQSSQNQNTPTERSPQHSDNDSDTGNSNASHSNDSGSSGSNGNSNVQSSNSGGNAGSSDAAGMASIRGSGEGSSGDTAQNQTQEEDIPSFIP